MTDNPESRTMGPTKLFHGCTMVCCTIRSSSIYSWIVFMHLHTTKQNVRYRTGLSMWRVEMEGGPVRESRVATAA